MADLPVVVIPADAPAMVGRSKYLDELRRFADVRLHSDRPRDDAEMLERLRPADILLNSRSSVKIPGSLLAQLPNLKMIAVCGIGYDAIDIPVATSQGIVVSNIPGQTATVVAEHAFGLMLAVSRRTAAMTARIKTGQWSSDLGVSLIGKRLGVVGTGNIGCEMIRLCRAFGMEVVAWSFHPDESKAETLGFHYVSLPELLASADVTSLHVRLSPETQHLIGRDQLLQMKPGAIVINTARAAVMDTTALVECLNSGHLFGAGVDVYDSEPVTERISLGDCDNVVLTPHCADQTPEGLDQLTLGCVNNIQAYLNGAPVNVVNPTVL